MTKASHEVLHELIEINTQLAEIVAELNPGKSMSAIANSLAKARERLTAAKAFEDGFTRWRVVNSLVERGLARKLKTGDVQITAKGKKMASPPRKFDQSTSCSRDDVIAYQNKPAGQRVVQVKISAVPPKRRRKTE